MDYSSGQTLAQLYMQFDRFGSFSPIAGNEARLAANEKSRHWNQPELVPANWDYVPVGDSTRCKRRKKADAIEAYKLQGW